MHHDLAREIAERAMVLLKNDEGLLPISKDKNLLVLGEFAKLQDIKEKEVLMYNQSD